jgi:flavodoxin I
MKAMVVYDSAYGNTEQIAQAIGKALGALEDVETRRVGDVQPEHLREVDLLIVGSPTQRFRPTPATTNLLKRIPNDGLEGVKVAGFDTRFSESEINKIRILAFFVRIFGYAAQPITDRLEKKGGELVVPAEGFYVADTEGPLLEGELERAAEWAKEIVRSTT